MKDIPQNKKDFNTNYFFNSLIVLVRFWEIFS